MPENQSKLHTGPNEKRFGPVPIEGWGDGAVIRATVRWDDRCRNGHNTFSVTGEIRRPGRSDCEAGGCLHDEILQAFPELAEAIEFHLASSDGPLHYIENTVYAAGDRDCWGLRAGEVRQIVNGRTGQPCWVRKGIASEYHDGPECPQGEVVSTWEPLNRVGEGKERELDKARAAAIWPDATDEDLTAPGLEQRLRDRLPALMERLRAVVEGLGFEY